MKRITLILSIILSFSVHAHLEHREGQNAQPSAQRLSLARGCFDEIQKEGCGHPRDGQEIFNSCLEEKIETLTPSCQSFFTKLYGRKRNS